MYNYYLCEFTDDICYQKSTVKNLFFFNQQQECNNTKDWYI